MRRPFSRIRVEDEPRPRSEAVEAPFEKLPSVMSTEEPEPKAGIECSRSCTVLAPVAAICLALITSTARCLLFGALDVRTGDGDLGDRLGRFLGLCKLGRGERQGDGDDTVFE